MKESSDPILVDLDGTLILTDSLHEMLIILIKKQPYAIFKLIKIYFYGKARFKQYVFEQVDYDAERVPYRDELVKYIKHEKQNGRKIYLATAAYKGVAEKTADFLQCFDGILATDSDINLKGINKLKAIQQNFGREFIYAGDNKADLHIWREAKGAIVVGNHVKKLSKEVEKSHIPVIKQMQNTAVRLSTWMRALRIHQWLKNILLFIPLLLAFQFNDLHKLWLTMVAFVSFSLGASATYILNDLWDLENDRAHPNKKLRPFASVDLSIAQGVKASAK